MQALGKILPDRFNSDGSEKVSCTSVSGTRTWGTDACVPIIAAVKTAMQIGTQPVWGAAEDTSAATVQCHTSNDPGLAVLTGDANCQLVTIENGLKMFKAKSTITCVNPIDNNRYDGVENCVEVDNAW